MPSSNDFVRAYLRFVVMTNDDLPSFKNKVENILAKNNVKGQHGYQDFDDHNQHTEDPAYVSFVYDQIDTRELVALSDALTKEFGECFVRVIQTYK